MYRYMRTSNSILRSLLKLDVQSKNTLQRHFADKSLKNVENLKKYDGNPQELLRHVSYPSDFDKKILVWMGKYKTVDDVPKKVMFEELYHAKNRFRIKVCNYMIVATIIGCLTAVVLGRQARDRGETVQKMNLDWHREMNKKIDAEEERKKH